MYYSIYIYNIKMGNNCIKLCENNNEINIDMALKAKYLSLSGKKMKGLCIRCIDGDTIDVSLKYIDNKYYIFTIRLDNIDTPELHPSKKSLTKEEYDTEVRNALVSKNFIEQQILQKEIDILVSNKKEKYGRILATVYYKNININKLMVDSGYACNYDGGKKYKLK